MRPHRAQCPVRIEAHLELCEEWMPVARERHVLIAIEPYAHRLARMMRCQRGERGGRGSLSFLATKTAAHARHLHHDLVRRQMQHMRNHLLHLRRMLSNT